MVIHLLVERDDLDQPFETTALETKRFGAGGGDDLEQAINHRILDLAHSPSQETS